VYMSLVAWHSGNEVTLCLARPVSGWVAVCGQVNHLAGKPASYVDSAFYRLRMGKWVAFLSWVAINIMGECSTIAASLDGSEA